MALTDKLTAIADAIREKTGATEELTLDAMAAAISDISGGGGHTVPQDLIAKVTIHVDENADYYLTGTILDQAGNVVSSSETIVNGSTYWLETACYYVVETSPSGAYDYVHVNIEKTAGDGYYSNAVEGGEISVLTFGGELTIEVTAEVETGWGGE